MPKKKSKEKEKKIEVVTITSMVEEMMEFLEDIEEMAIKFDGAGKGWPGAGIKFRKEMQNLKKMVTDAKNECMNQTKQRKTK